MKKIIIATVLLLTTLGAAAQQTKEDSISANRGFDATTEMFQKRYRHPDAVPFDTAWKNNLYVTLYAGMDQLLTRGNAKFNTGSVMGGGLNWQFAPAHALRGSVMMGRLTRSIDKEILTRFGIEADYLLNVSTYTAGYNPGRILEFLTVAGVGVQFSHFLGSVKPVPEMHVGMQLKLHPSAHVDFFIEPRFSLMSDNIDHSGETNWHKYDMSYGAIVGMNYRFKAWRPIGKLKMLVGDDFLDNTFISVAAGGQWQSPLPTEGLGATQTMGPHYYVSAGKWLLPAIALRASLFKSADTWHQKHVGAAGSGVVDAEDAVESFYEGSAYGGARLEGMLDLTYFVNGNQINPKFSTNLLVGGELGYIRKENGNYPSKGGYTGFTGGLQLKYRLWDDFALFVEPRTTMASYTLKTAEMKDDLHVAKKFTDKLYSVNLGIEIRRSDEENRLARSIYREEFKPSYFASGMVGGSIPLEMRRYELKRHFGYYAGAAIGRNFSPLSSLRLSADFAPMTLDLRGTEYTFNMVSASLDYMLNMSNLMMGYDPMRKYDVHLLAGIVGSMRMAPDKVTGVKEMNDAKMLVGGELGLQASYQVHPLVKVFIEPKARFYSTDMMRQGNIHGMDIISSISVGGTYHFQIENLFSFMKKGEE